MVNKLKAAGAMPLGSGRQAFIVNIVPEPSSKGPSWHFRVAEKRGGEGPSHGVKVDFTCVAKPAPVPTETGGSGGTPTGTGNGTPTGGGTGATGGTGGTGGTDGEKGGTGALAAGRAAPVATRPVPRGAALPGPE